MDKYRTGAAIIQGVNKGLEYRRNIQAQEFNQQRQVKQDANNQANQDNLQKQQELMIRQLSMKVEKQESEKIKSDFYSAWDEGSVISLNKAINSNDRARKLFGVQNVNFFPLVPTAKQIAMRNSGADGKPMKEPMIGTQVNPDGTIEEIVFDMAKKKIGSGYYTYKQDLEYKKQEQELRKQELLVKVKNAGTKETSFKQNLAYEAKTRGISEKEVLALRDNKNVSKIIKKQEYKDNKIKNILSTAKVDEIFDVDYTKLDSDAQVDFNNQIKQELKGLSTNDTKKIDSFNSIGAAASKLNIDKLDQITGPVDATFSTILDTLGIDKDKVNIDNETQAAVMRNTIVKLMSGSQVTGNEWSRMKAQLGTNFKGDKTASSKLGNVIQETITSMETIKASSPAYYAKFLRPKVEKLTELASDLKGNTKTKVSVGTKVKGPDGNLYIINAQGKPERVNK